jgi:hypothetical protein
LKRGTALRELIETILSNMRTAEAQPTERTGEGDGDAIADMCTLVVPPVSQTKVRGTNMLRRLNEESGSRASTTTSTYKRKQTKDGQVIISGRTCTHCHMKDHYLTTCPSNLNRSHAVECRGSGRGGVRKGGRPRTRRCSNEETYDEVVDDTEENIENEEDWFDGD